MGNRALLAAFCLVIGVVFRMVAQADALTDAETEARADLIRLDENYLFAERFFVEKENADRMVMEEQALAELAITVNTMRVPEGKKALKREDLLPVTDIMVYRVGKRCCVFFYISKEKAMSFTPSAAENIAGTAVGDGPAVNPDEASPEEATSAVTIVPGGVTDQAEEAGAATVSLSRGAMEVVEAIEARSGLMLGELGKLLRYYKTEGQIEDFGQMKPGASVPGNTCMVVVDRSLKVTAVLVPYSDGTIRDIVSGSADDPSSYHNHGIVWFR